MILWGPVIQYLLSGPGPQAPLVRRFDRGSPVAPADSEVRVVPLVPFRCYFRLKETE